MMKVARATRGRLAAQGAEGARKQKLPKGRPGADLKLLNLERTQEG